VAVNAASVGIGQRHRQTALHDDDAGQRSSLSTARATGNSKLAVKRCVRRSWNAPNERQIARVVIDGGVRGGPRVRVRGLATRERARLLAQRHLQAVVGDAPVNSLAASAVGVSPMMGNAQARRFCAVVGGDAVRGVAIVAAVDPSAGVARRGWFETACQRRRLPWLHVAASKVRPRSSGTAR